MRSFGATPFVRSSFNCSVTYCSGFCFVANVAVSDMLLLLMVGIGRGGISIVLQRGLRGKPRVTFQVFTSSESCSRNTASNAAGVRSFIA